MFYRSVFLVGRNNRLMETVRLNITLPMPLARELKQITAPRKLSRFVSNAIAREIKYLKKIGADAVGMSTVPEVIRGNELGINISAISCITNYASGVTDNKLSHKEVFETAETVKFVFGKLITEVIKNI